MLTLAISTLPAIEEFHWDLWKVTWKDVNHTPLGKAGEGNVGPRILVNTLLDVNYSKKQLENEDKLGGNSNEY